MTSKRWILAIILLLSLCVSHSVFASTDISIPMYQISVQELNRLDDNLTTLAQINKQSQQELIALKSELITVSRELNALKPTSIVQENLLATANKSLEQSANEVQRKQRIIKRQRNFAYFLCAGLVYAMIK